MEIGIVTVLVTLAGFVLGYGFTSLATAGLPTEQQLAKASRLYADTQMRAEIPSGTGTIHQARGDQYIDQSTRFYRTAGKEYDKSTAERAAIGGGVTIAITIGVLLVAMPAIGYLEYYLYSMTGIAAATCGAATRLSSSSQKTQRQLFGQGRNVQSCCMILVGGLIAIWVVSAFSLNSTGGTIWNQYESTEFQLSWSSKIWPWSAAAADDGLYLYFVLGIALWVLGLYVVLFGLTCWAAALRDNKTLLKELTPRLNSRQRVSRRPRRLEERLADSFEDFGGLYVLATLLFVAMALFLTSGWLHDLIAPSPADPDPAAIDGLSPTSASTRSPDPTSVTTT